MVSFKCIFKYFLFRFKYIFKTYFLTVVCFFVLGYQTNQLFSEYIRGKTVVTINVRKLPSVSLPGITLCTPNVLAIEKASRMSKEFAKTYSDYKEMNDQLDNSNETEEISLKIVDLFQNLTKQINLSQIPAIEIIDNWTVSFEEKFIFYKIIIEGLYENGSDTNTKFTSDDVILQPIESLKWSKVLIYKCFTFFSALNKQWRNFEMNMVRITIKNLKPKLTWLPPGEKLTLFISIHSPNSLPELNEENFVELKIDRDYLFYYNQVKTKLLDSRYDTNCYKYDLDYKYANFNMRSDCITSCYQNKLKEKCNLEYFVASSNLLRSDYVKHYPGSTLDNKNRCGSRKELKSSCYLGCRFDCSFNYYALDKLEKNVNSSENNSTSSFNINIQRNNFPDVVIKHLPQITTMTFICNFGGLLGMWLGLSLLSIFESSIKILKIVFNRIYLNKITFQNNNYFVKLNNKRNIRVFNINN